MSKIIRKSWIWFWYNDVVRVLGVLLGGFLVPTALAAYRAHVPAEALKDILITQYILTLAWAMIDNDYSHLNEIGLDVNRKPLKKTQEGNKE